MFTSLVSVTSFSYTYFITYFISYFNEKVLLTIIINRLSSTLKIVLINCQNFDLTNIQGGPKVSLHTLGLIAPPCFIFEGCCFADGTLYLLVRGCCFADGTIK